jgi:hypothetical protein
LKRGGCLLASLLLARSAANTVRQRDGGAQRRQFDRPSSTEVGLVGTSWTIDLVARAIDSTTRAPIRDLRRRHWWPRLARGEDVKLTLIHCQNCNRVNELLTTLLGTGGSPEASMRSVFHLNV